MKKVSEVFVAGGQPKLTYVARSDLKLEEQIKSYLEARHKMLSISGPTKTGKTVLVRSVVPKSAAYWISGGQIQSLAALWDQVVEQGGGFTSETVSDEGKSAEKTGREFGASAKVAGFGGDAKSVVSTEKTTAKGSAKTREVSVQTAALALLRRNDRPLILDDFHYVTKEVQAQIIRALKDPVFDGLPVILLSVPHRAYDAVRVEREMTGRVQQLEVPFWKPEELRAIAERGFRELKVLAAEEVVEKLVNEAFSSPHLMQDFCGDLCRESGINEEQGSPTPLPPPSDWNAFFRRRATGAAKSAFDRLAIGPRQRTDRMPRKLLNGKTLDIYAVILLAIAQTGPLTQLRYEEIRQALREILVPAAIPQSNEITSVLERMSKIAKEEIEGEAVVDWDREYSTLYISDPFFAYFLRWGTLRES